MVPELPPTVILAGGLGTRLRPVIAQVPKALAMVAGQPFILHQLAWLHRSGVRLIILCIGYRGEQIADCLGDGTDLDLQIVYSWEDRPLGTAGALAQAAHLLPSEFLVINGDTYTELDLKLLWNAHRSHAATATLAVTTTSDSRAGGGIELAKDGRILSFREKESGAVLVSMGIYAVSRRILKHIPTNRPCSLEKDVFPALPGLYGYQAEVSFIDMGTPADYQALDLYLRSLDNDSLERSSNP